MGENGNLNKAQLPFKNSTITNQIRNITIEGENDNNIASNNAYLLYQDNDAKFKNISCTIIKKNGNNKIFNLICKPLTTFKGNLSFASVYLIDTIQIMYLDFKENYPFVNFTFQNVNTVIIHKESSGGLSEGVIVIIIFVSSLVLSCLIRSFCKRYNS